MLQGYRKLFSSREARRARVLPSITKHRLAYVVVLVRSLCTSISFSLSLNRCSFQVHHALTGADTINTEFNQDMYYAYIYDFLSAPENEEFWRALQVRLQS